MTETEMHRWDRSWMRRFTKRYGHRAAFVWLISACWVLMGIIVALGDQPPAPYLFHTHFPIPLRAMFWIVPALISAMVAQTEHEWWAFVVLGLPAAQRLASFWVGVWLSQRAEESAWVGWELFGRGFVYLVILLLMWLVATWPNPVDEDGFDIDDDEDPEDE
jgi:hypothetical protein